MFKMKKTFLLICAVLLAAFVLTSCEQRECRCTYYNNNNEVTNIETWDASEVTAEQCQAMESGNDNVSCDIQW